MCCGDTTPIVLDKNCYIKKFPDSNDDRHKRLMVRVAHASNTGMFQPCFHLDCAHNQIRSLVGRVAGPTPKPTGLGIARLKQAAKAISYEIPLTSANHLYDMPERYSGAKRKRYLDACDEVGRTGLCKSDASIKMFVKPERFDPEARADPDPRAIQFRASKYCVCLGAFLHPIEHHIYDLDCASAGVPRSRNVAKGLNSVARARLLLEKSASFEHPAYLSLDASRFDKHVSVALLRIEHSVYLRSNPDPWFMQLLSWQLTNKGFSNLGLKYKVEGRRMSGDMNTAAGNCLLMLIMLVAAAQEMGLRKWDCLDDGDDVILLVESPDVAKVRGMVQQTFLQYGMQMKVEGVVENVHQVVFCRSNMISIHHDCSKFVRHYRTVMSTALCGIRHWTDDKYRLRVLHAVGTCELVLNLGVPVLQEFAVCILRNVGSGQVADLSLAPEGLRARTLRDLRALGITVQAVEPSPITQMARDTFAEAFGLDEVQQLRLESQLASWTFETRGYSKSPSDVLVEGWVIQPSMTEVYDLIGKW